MYQFMDEKYISQRISQLRMNKDVSAREMSLSLGRAHNYINNIEVGNSTPSFQEFFYICEYFNVSPSEFFDDKSTNPSLLNNVIEQLKPLNDKALESILELAGQLRNKK